MATLTGLAGDDSLSGAGAADVFNLFQGGNDTAEGRGGDDNFHLGAVFAAGDHIDGGLGIDWLWLDGDYSALTITPGMITGVEEVELAAGGTYDITLADGVATASRGIDFFAHGPVAIDASAEADSRVLLSAGVGGFDFIGGGGQNVVHIVALLPTDRMVAGAGNDDELSIRGGGVFSFTDQTLSDVEYITVGSPDPAAVARITLADGNVAAGDRLTLVSQSQGVMRVDGRREKDGSLNLQGSQFAADTLIGGKGDDTLGGRGGDDVLSGGKGADLLDVSFAPFSGDATVRLLSRKDSRFGDGDTIAGANAGDVIDLSGVDADKEAAGDQAFTVVEAFTGAAGEAVFSYDENTGLTQLLLEINGKPGADMEISLAAGFPNPPSDYTGFGGFVYLGPGTRAHPRPLPPIPRPSWPGPNAAIDKSLSIADAIARPLMHIRIGRSSWVAGSGSRRGHKSTYVDLWPKNGPSPPRQALWGVARRVKCRRQTRLQRQSDQRHRQRHFSGNGKLGDRSNCPPRRKRRFLQAGVGAARYAPPMRTTTRLTALAASAAAALAVLAAGAAQAMPPELAQAQAAFDHAQIARRQGRARAVPGAGLPAGERRRRGGGPRGLHRRLDRARLRSPPRADPRAGGAGLDRRRRPGRPGHPVGRQRRRPLPRHLPLPRRLAPRGRPLAGGARPVDARARQIGTGALFAGAAHRASPGAACLPIAARSSGGNLATSSSRYGRLLHSAS